MHTSSTLGCVLSRIMACRYTALGLMVKRCRKYSPAKATMAADSDCMYTFADVYASQVQLQPSPEHTEVAKDSAKHKNGQ